ncbi:sporulation protein [Staphylococcus schleiferi]|uniref:sporulation protein n=1 Tax=Staphylococcus schleiferi TaxID=1295 RepID=UPI0024805C32|nr:sporulation protein [Staphylococcus schleiferi]
MGFDNVLTSLGINGMKVFIRLNQREYDLSDTISGCVHLKAGQSDQKVTHIVLTMIEKYPNDDETSDFSYLTHELDRFVIDEAFTIDVGEDKKIDFSFKSESLTFKSLKSHIYLHTHVYIGHGLDEEMEAVIPYRR